MSGIRKCAECGKLFKIENEGPEPMLSDGTFPRHVCSECRSTEECAVCGKKFDPADLTQVLYHMKHEPVPVLTDTNGQPIRGEKVEP